MVDAQLLKDAAEIGAYALIFGEAVGYIAKGILHRNVKNGLEKKVEEGDMERKEADYRLQSYKICMFLPWPIDKIYAVRRMKRYNEKEKATPIKE